MTQKRFSELSLFKLWVVPAAAFWLCAAGFVGGLIAERNSDPNKPLIPVPYPTVVTGGVAIAMYSWLFGLAVVDAERKRMAKGNDSDQS